MIDKREKDSQKHLTFRKQLTFHERNDRFTIKSLIQNIKLKTRIRNIIDKLPSRRQKKMDEFHYNLVGDLSDKSMNSARAKNSGDNQINFEVPVFIHEAQVSQMRKLRRLQSLLSKQVSQQQNAQSLFHVIKQILSFNYIKQAVVNGLNNIPIIDPNIIWKLIWDFIMCIQILVLCFVASVRITDINDSLSTYAGESRVILIVFIILQSVDMILCANTGYYQRGMLVKKKEDVVKKYIVKHGFLDIITLQALLFELSRWQVRVNLDKEIWNNTSKAFYEIGCCIEAVLLLLYYLKGMRITKLMTKLEEEFQLDRKSLNILQLVKLFVFVLIVSHIFACIWLFTGKNSNLNVTWLTFYKLDFESWKTQYIRAQYFASVTMITVGYGDTVPQNETERVVGMIGMILTCGVFAYSINSIGNILTEFQKESAQRKESMLIICQYMREKNIQRNLQSEIREYLEYYWKEWNETQIEKEEQIISQLSDNLRRDLLFQANKTIIHETSLLTHYFSDFFIQKIIHIIKEFKATPNQIIVCNQGQESRKGIVFFVEKGEFDIYHIPLSDFDQLNNSEISSGNGYQAEGGNEANQTQNPSYQRFQNGAQNNYIMKKVKTIGPGEHFGFESFFTDKPHKVVVKSKDFCKLLYIDRQDFIELMKKHNLLEDYEKFCFIRDSLINDNNLTLLGSKCVACKKSDHTLNECSYVHYVANRYNLISRFNISNEITERVRNTRRWPFRKRQNPLSNIIYYTESACDFIQNNKQYLDEVLNYEEYSFVSSYTSSYSNDSSDYDSSEESDTQEKVQQAEIVKESNYLIPLIELDKSIEESNIQENIQVKELKIDKFEQQFSDSNDDDKNSSISPRLKERHSKNSIKRGSNSTKQKSPQLSSHKKSEDIKSIELRKSIIDEINSLNSSQIKRNSNSIQGSSSRSRSRTINDYLDKLNLNMVFPFNKVHNNNEGKSLEAENLQQQQQQIQNFHNIYKSNHNYEKKLSLVNEQPRRKESKLKVQTPGRASNNNYNNNNSNSIQNVVPHKRASIFSKEGFIFKEKHNQQFDFTSIHARNEIIKPQMVQNIQEQYPKQNSKSKIDLPVIKEGSSKQIKVYQDNKVDQQDQNMMNNNIEQQFNFKMYQNYKIFDDFEKLQSYKFYFPQYNYDRIIANIKKKRNQLIQKQLNLKNKLNVNDDILSIHQSPLPLNKIQKQLKQQLGFQRSNTRQQSQFHNKFGESLILRQSLHDSQASQNSPKKNTQKTNNSPMNISNNEQMSFTNSQNLHSLNNENILSQDKLTDQIPKEDFNFNSTPNPQIITININPRRKNEKAKTSLFSVQNVKFAPLKKKLETKQSNIDMLDFDQFSNDL